MTDQPEMLDIPTLLRTAPLIDGHNDLLWELRVQAGYDFDRLDIAATCPTLQTDLPRLRQGCVGAQFWSVWVPSDLPLHAAVTTTLEQLDAWRRMVARYPADLGMALSVGDIERVVASGRIASLAGVEGGHSIADSLAVLRTMYQLGARYMTLTHNDNTSWADSAVDIPVHHGLTAFGEEVVREMNRLGMMVDLSHVSPAVMHDALRVTAAPVIFSHSSARALCDHPRNVPDDVLAKLAGNGGVCMVTFVPGFIDPVVAEIFLAGDAYERDLRAEHPDDPDRVEALIAAARTAHPLPPTDVRQVADHIDHIREVVGVAHIGIGSDFDGVPIQPTGLADVSQFPNLFVELRRRGYSDSESRDIAGRNVLRVFSGARAA
ncbi:MAG: dipeptidase [Candidatus Nanopelagicales bacterium]